MAFQEKWEDMAMTFKFNIIPSRIVGGDEIPSMSAKLVLAEAKNSNKDQVQ
jgi:hypothetical protein